ncbi:MAG: hypothetical protein M3O50_11065 [Myxococcota bacterium]|nr:hypothetical protein [Myxococcota bacterium]
MGIDGIRNSGKSGSGAPPSRSEQSGATPNARAERPFQATLPEPAQTAPASALGPGNISRSALDRLRAGDLDLNGYVDVKVNDATAHLKALPASELEAVRSALRTRMASDPTLVELVRTVTGGHAPEPSSEE